MTSSSTKTFKAKLVPMGEGGAWKCIFIPFDVPETFGTRARVSVAGTINGFPYQTSIFPMRDGRFMMMVNKAMQKGAELSEGDEVKVTMAKCSTKPKTEIPAELEKALAANRTAQLAFEKLSPSSRREHIRFVAEAKRPETRQRRAKRTVKEVVKSSTLRPSRAKRLLNLLRSRK